MTTSIVHLLPQRGFLFAPKEVDNSFCSLRRVEGVAVEIVSDLCIDLFQLQITHKPQQTGQRKWGDNGNSVGLQSDFACFLKVHFANVILPTPTSTLPGGLDDGWFWQGDDSVWENAVCIIPEHLSRHFRIYFYNTADSVVQFQRCLLFCDKLKRSGLLYKRSARFVCHQQLLCQLSPIDKVSGRCMLGADILLYKVMSACMKSMLVFLLLFFAFLCPPFWINKSSTIFNDDADLTAVNILLNWFAFMQLLLQSMLAVRFGVWKAASRIFIDSFTTTHCYNDAVLIDFVERIGKNATCLKAESKSILFQCWIARYSRGCVKRQMVRNGEKRRELDGG
ncbi:hypothetical protein T4E_7867 [Trichinella pseudospiralis]|uniref:Uncharacterized protein n=1 Tax=Trichinella pseudospiralis TaxID=6337 RepID=A0A0V0XKE2_TRIPS|nr:hypothetical protein T4E_7867 [Trichinella pseudospiralis]